MNMCKTKVQSFELNCVLLHKAFKKNKLNYLGPLYDIKINLEVENQI